MTKTAMAKRIVQVLYNLASLPAPNHPEVKREARGSVKGVTGRYELAKRVAEKQIAATGTRYPHPSEWETHQAA